MKSKLPRLNRKYAILLVVALLIVFGIVMGVSYAFFTSTVAGKEYVVNTGTLEISFEEKTNVVNLQAARPMTNTEGLATTPYSFDVKNVGSLLTKYQVRLETDNSNTLPLEYVKISIYKNDTEYLKPTKLSDLNSTLVIVDNGLINANDTDNYKVRLWIDINAGNDMMGKIFKAKVVIDAMQNVEDGFDTNTKPIIVLNKDANGNTDLLLNVNDTYTELGVQEVKDDKDKIKVSDVTTTGTVDTTTKGVYPITYTVTDSDNNTTIVTRNIIVNDGTLDIYKSVEEVKTAFINVENKDAVSCSTIHGNIDIYLNCEVNDSLQTALNSKNNSFVLMTNNITESDYIIIQEGKEITLDLNGKTIETNLDDVGRKKSIKNSGNLIINDSQGNATFNGGISNEKSGILTINDGTFTNDYSDIMYNYGDLIINNATFNCTSSGDVTAINNYSTMIINDGTFTAAANPGIKNSFNATINGGEYNGFYNDRIATITGGTYTGSVDNYGGTLNIIQTDKPIYIRNIENGSTSVSHYGLPKFEPTYTININAHAANACTDNPSDTTSGLCVWYSDSSFASVESRKGFVNIIGGTYVGTKYALHNVNGTFKICDATVSGYVSSSPAENLYYHNITTLGSTKMNGTESTTCPITD